MKVALALLCLLLLGTCAPAKKTGEAGNTPQKSSLPRKSAPASTSSGRNNQISIISTGVASGSGPGTKVVFKGSNNLFEVVQHNPTFFDRGQDVIIIEGDGNIIKLYNQNLVERPASNSKDTLVLVGNKQKYVVDMGQGLKLKRAPTRIDTVEMQTRPLLASSFTQNLEDNSFGLGLVQELLGNIAKGDQEAYLKLAEIYHYGLHDVPSSTPKAVELYEYAAAKGDVDAIRRLGDLWYNGAFDLKQDFQKARYYYLKGAQMGDDHCKQQLGPK
ncbi:MAG: tetratricopeptide repeat protein [Rufibacter sp.]